MFFILSSGADPIKEVTKIAKTKGIVPGKTFFEISLGEGQDVIATNKIETGSKEGHWIMLQNVHLMPAYLTELEKILDNYKSEG